MKKAYLFLTIASVIGAIVLLFFFSSQEETLSVQQKRARDYVSHPCEYQLVITDDSIIITDFGRPVTSIHLDSAGRVGQALIDDNQ